MTKALALIKTRKKKRKTRESVVRGNHRATCHIDNRRCFYIEGEGQGLLDCGVVHVGHAIFAAGHCLLFRVAHVQVARNANTLVTNRIF